MGLQRWGFAPALAGAVQSNWIAGETVPNVAAVQLSRDGTFDLSNAYGSADVIIDVAGWYR